MIRQSYVGWGALGDIWKHIYLEPRNYGALWRSIFAPYKYPYLLTYLLNTYFVWRDIFSLSGWLWMKLGTSNHHVSGHCWKRFQGQRSMSCRVRSRREWPETAYEVDDFTCVKWITTLKPNNLLVSNGVNAAMWRKHTFWRCSVEAPLF